MTSQHRLPMDPDRPFTKSIASENKPQLQHIANFFGLSSEGTTVALRQRLLDFLRTNASILATNKNFYRLYPLNMRQPPESQSAQPPPNQRSRSREESWNGINPTGTGEDLRREDETAPRTQRERSRTLDNDFDGHIDETNRESNALVSRLSKLSDTTLQRLLLLAENSGLSTSSISFPSFYHPVTIIGHTPYLWRVRPMVMAHRWQYRA